MDADQFDALSRSLVAAGSSRRRHLSGLLGLSLGALVASRDFPEAEARKKKGLAMVAW